MTYPQVPFEISESPGLHTSELMEIFVIDMGIMVESKENQ